MSRLACILVSVASACDAQPLPVLWPLSGPDDTAAVAAAAVSGMYAAADSFEDSVELRDIRAGLSRTITRAEIAALAPWMSLGSGPDGPGALALSDSGRLLFIAVHDDTAPGPGQPSDVVLRYDSGTGALTRFATLDLFDNGAQWPHLAMTHFRGRLYVGAAAGGVAAYRALRNDTTGMPLSPGMAPLPDGGPVRGLAVDRDRALLFAASASNLYRANAAAWPPSFALVGPLADAVALAWSDHYGGAGQDGLYVLESTEAQHRIRFVSGPQSRGEQAFAPALYLTGPGWVHDLAATACGRLLAGIDEDAVMIADARDPRPAFDAWVRDEFARVVRFAKSLVLRDLPRRGWVIDADVDAGGTRFHPASPDAAGWAVLLFILVDELDGDIEARLLAREVLLRHAGMSGAGGEPTRSADGMFLHWYDPAAGGPMSGWTLEYATLSTMKIVAAAERAAAYYADDPAIREAARRIVCRVRNHDAYVSVPGDGLYFRGQPGGGPDAQSGSRPFHEGIIFVEQAAAYGGPFSRDAFVRWLDRWRWPTATCLTGRPITGDVPGQFQAAFVSLYPLLVQRPYRDSPAWRTQVANLRDSNAAWTDDTSPRFNTVFSAGTTRPEWAPGGYHADNLGNHPGDIATFPSLLAFAAAGGSADAVGAYHAFRLNARQTFSGGASILYRRSQEIPTYEPDSAGLPDVALGSIGLAELRAPGIIDHLLARPYAPCPCQADCDLSTGPGTLDIFDFLCFQNLFAAADPYACACDLSTGYGVCDIFDFLCYQNAFSAGCP